MMNIHFQPRNNKHPKKYFISGIDTISWFIEIISFDSNNGNIIKLFFLGIKSIKY